ncbi:MAG: pyruvate kinase [Actinobacteria bacterium]|nr:pyruvate kinase [Actinomycetota bacterium]
MSERRTKIVATLGPATDDPLILRQMIRAGVDGVRINCSHGTREDWLRHAWMARDAAASVGRHVAIMFDLQGPKIRLHQSSKRLALTEGDRVRIVGDPKAPGATKSLIVEWPGLVDAAVLGTSELVIGDGAPRIAVLEREKGALLGTCIIPGEALPRRGAFLTHAVVDRMALSDKDRADVRVAIDAGADFIALSFVNQADDIQELRKLLGSTSIRIIAKIETLAAIESLDSIVEASDAVMVARGDLGVEAGVARVPLLQKRIIQSAGAHGKLVITATQMLESMSTAPEPTRAEASDVANAVMDGTSCVMLSGETATGRYPVEAVTQMAAIAANAQEGVIPMGVDMTAHGATVAESVMRAAVFLARDIKAAALVIPTATGGSARAAAKFRPRRPIVALCADAGVARQLALEWGVIPEPLHARPDESVEALVERCLLRAQRRLDIPEGERVVLTSGPQVAHPGATSLIAVHRIEAQHRG